MASSEENSAKDASSVLSDMQNTASAAKAGRPWFRKKRFFLPILAIVLIIIFAACSSRGQSTTQSGLSSGTASVAADTPAPATPSFKTQKVTGSGDYVVKFEVDSPAIVTFSCPNCSGNTVLETDGAESLLVNEIGGYSGQHLINTGDGSITTKFSITADAKWTLTIADISAVRSVSGPVTGKGDSVVNLTSSFDTAAVKNVGEGNFAVYGYGAGSQDLVINEIGSYKGVVNLVGPGVVEITSSGAWSITPQ